jgi:glycosyltransferase involved in cell wall biosynthesis
MIQQLSRAAILVLPARYEPFGLSALEAGLSGCALVLGDIPSLREIWHEAAIFVDPDDTLGFTNALNSLVEDARRRKDFGRRARARALTFSPHQMANEYLTAYSSCLRVKSSGAAATPSLVLEEVAA